MSLNPFFIIARFLRHPVELVTAVAVPANSGCLARDKWVGDLEPPLWSKIVKFKYMENDF